MEEICVRAREQKRPDKLLTRVIQGQTYRPQLNIGSLLQRLHIESCVFVVRMIEDEVAPTGIEPGQCFKQVVRMAPDSVIAVIHIAGIECHCPNHCHFVCSSQILYGAATQDGYCLAWLAVVPTVDIPAQG